MKNNLKGKVENLMQKNRRVHRGHQYTVPSPETYPYQWLWDSCFNAIILSHINPEDSKKELRSLLSKQFEDGMIPHMIYWDKESKNDFPVIEWGNEDTSTITQPPLIAYAALCIFKKDPNLNFLKEIYEGLRSYYTYLLRDRDPQREHLIGIINPDESGEDNSSRFDLPLGLPPHQTMDKNLEKRLGLVEALKTCDFDAPGCMRRYFWVKDIPFNCIAVEDLIAISKIASYLSKTDDSKFFASQANLIKAALRSKCRSESGLFLSTYSEKDIPIQTKTWAIFAPLFCNLLNLEEADNLVNNYLLNPNEFGLDYLVPTVSKSDVSFDPKGFWRGPIWICVNWFICSGLKKYGYSELAQKILNHSLELVENEGFREYFNPLTGEGLGANDFTWGGLVLDMIEG